jgi:hypothetical protein
MGPAAAEDSVFRPGLVLEALARAKVRVIVVGAFAAVLRGIPGVLTRDIDIAPALDAGNLQRLAEVLHAHGATVRIEGHTRGPVELPADGGLIARAPILNLHLPAIGDVDVIHSAAAATQARAALTFDVLSRAATPEPLPGTRRRVLVMSEQDWVDAKRTPPVRPRDREHLDAYERWAAERGRSRVAG